MSAIAIERPIPTRNYNTNYNAGEFHDALPDLKMRDIHLLIYLLSLPAKWNLNRKYIAKKLKMGVWTIGDSLRNLVKAGIASYRRFSNGTVEWTLKLPDTIIVILEGDKKADKAAKAAATEPEPCSEFPTWAKPAWEIHTALETNDLLEINKKTTNVVEPEIILELIEPLEVLAVNPEINLTPAAVVAVENNSIATPVTNVVSADVEAKIPSTLPTSEKKAVKNELAKLPSPELQLNVLIVLTAAIAKGNVPKPVGYAVELVRRALNGTLTLPNPTNKPLSPLEKEKSAEQKLFDFFLRNLDKLKHDFLELKKDYIYVRGLGNITRDDFRKYMAIYSGTVRR